MATTILNVYNKYSFSYNTNKSEESGKAAGLLPSGPNLKEGPKANPPSFIFYLIFTLYHMC